MRKECLIFEEEKVHTERNESTRFPGINRNALIPSHPTVQIYRYQKAIVVDPERTETLS